MFHLKAELHFATSGLELPNYRGLAKLQNEIMDVLGDEYDPLGRGPKQYVQAYFAVAVNTED